MENPAYTHSAAQLPVGLGKLFEHNVFHLQVGTNGEVVHLNSFARDLLGQHEPGQDLSWDDLMIEGNPTVAWGMLAKAIQRGELTSRIVAFRHRLGKLVYMFLNFEKAGDVVHVLGWDVTAQVQLTEVCKRQQEELSWLTKAGDMYFLQLSSIGKILYVNRTPAGLKMEEVLGRSLLDFFSPRLHQHIAGVLSEVQLKGKPGYFEGKAVGDNNQLYWYGIHLYPLEKDIEGNDRILAVARNINADRDAERKLATEERKSRELQAQLLSSQINPHFIFNAMNAIQAFILEQSVETALDYVSDFSKLIRSVLQNSNHPMISLGDEVEFLVDYLELEKRRFKSRFDYQVMLESGLDVNLEIIPPMLIQPFVENAVVHGVGRLKKRSDGLITIRFRQEKGFLVCQVQDNGSGWDASGTQIPSGRGKFHESLGHRITSTRIQLLNRGRKRKYGLHISEVKGVDGKSRGTLVELRFPV
ncbi:MAG: histidine kinase [Flavobacteriales bacterium]|nr:histidine kinase [Flavobacteriales bacterium]MCB9447961.1 histidine kinase [Flavobacteriales bacterium]